MTNKQAIHFIHEGLKKMSNNDFEGACNAFDIAVGLNPNIQFNLDCAIAYKWRCEQRAIKKQVRLGYDKDLCADVEMAMKINPHIKLPPACAFSFMYRGETRFKMGDYINGMMDFYIAITLDPTCSTIYFMRGKSKFKLGDYAGACTDFNLAVDFGYTSPVVYLLRGRAKYLLNKPQEAVEDFDHVFILKKAFKGDRDIARAYIDAGKINVEKGCFKAAADNFDKAILCDNYLRLGCEAALAYAKRGLLRQSSGDWCGAHMDLKKAKDLDEGVGAIYILKGKINFDAKKYAVAADYFDVACKLDSSIKLDPSWAIAYVSRSILNYEVGKINEALEDCYRATELSRDKLYQYVLRSMIYSGTGRFVSTAAIIYNAIKSGAENALKYVWYGLLKYDAGDLFGALSYCNRAINSHEYLHTKIDELNEAHLNVVDHFNYAIKYNLYDHLAIVYAWRGAFKLEARDIEGAIHDCNKAIELDQKCWAAYVLRGNVVWHQFLNVR